MLDIYNKIFNIDPIDDFENFNIIIKKIDNYYFIKYKNNMPANIYYYKLDGIYLYCLDETALSVFLTKNNIVLTENVSYTKYINKSGKKNDSKITTNHYQEISRICIYDSVKLYTDHFEADYVDLYSVNIHDAGYLIKDWIAKYKKLVSDNYQNIIPEMSAGLDTRSLTYFWRDLKIKDVYTKDDPMEKDIACDVIKRISEATINIGHKPKYPITLSGKGIIVDPSRFLKEHYYKNNTGQFKVKHITEYITPYLDKNIAMIKPDNIQQLKYTMQYLLARDLMDIPYKSFLRKSVIFTEEIEKDANQLIKEWGF